ncbi:methyltransferase domain-containing protein [Gracilibacillus salitolerans]|uniref:Methyltransferase domain-containing protein n=1 Tax=Gracilibacillus salitolerans TaxID=2663022 RepID=A0A5Q2TNS1_9BACI|nr:class I SAM-dependent methyltransferase [Gracilibacillus salitolerans]QGH35500.1 methyltransferase domain-containing protein [Gracilibacillus salitolerans]
MGIDFHSKKSRMSYTTRIADNSWTEVIKDFVPIKNISKALDIGCGGGIYSKALSDMGVENVTGVDFSEAILKGARENCKAYKNISFKHGNALETGLDSDSYHLLLERALIHHIKDLYSCFQEAYRVLNENGYFLIQDRTPEDCLLEGTDNNIRGYFFELFPKLIEKENNRRYKSQFVMETLKDNGFREIEEVKLWETRKVYDTKELLLKDLHQRTGRSILHELDDGEINVLINHIDQSIPKDEIITEKDRWTIWKAIK